MKNNCTELVFILDASGSMSPLVSDTIGGFNSMLHCQRETEGEVYVSCVLFSNSSSVLLDRVPIAGVEDLTDRQYVPGGCTALLDALGDAMRHIGNIHKYARPEDVPEHTLFVIITDGEENASFRWTAEDVRRRIKEQQEKYGWQFVFLGANIDAVSTARRYGISRGCAMEWEPSPAGMSRTMDAASSAIRHARSGRNLADSDWQNS